MVERVDGPAFRKAGALCFLALATLDIGAETTGPCSDFLTGEWVLAERFRFVRSSRFAVGVSAELAGILAFGIVGAADECTVFPKLQRQHSCAAGRARTRIATVFSCREHQRRQFFVQCVENIGDAQFLDVIDITREVAPEIAQNVFPGKLAVRNKIELFLKVCREIIFHIALEETLKEGGDQTTLGFRNELALVDGDVFAITQRGQSRGIGRRTTDTEFFHLLDERSFRIARRRFGRMLGRIDLLARQSFTGTNFRQLCTILVVVLFFAMIHIGCEEAIELSDRPIGAQHGRARAVDRLNVDCCTLNVGSLHLAGDGALPDELIEPRLIVIEIATHILRVTREIRWPDGFVRFLCVLCLAGIIARLFRHIFCAEAFADGVAGRVDGFWSYLHAIGTHIGDQAGSLAANIDTFVKSLRHLHGARGRKSELAGCGLLQG